MTKGTPQESYDTRISYLRHLYESPARQRLTDFFLTIGETWDEDSRPLSKTDIIEATDMQRKSIIRHIDEIAKMGIVNINEEHRHDRYEPAIESEPYNALLHVNNILLNHYREHKEDHQ